MSTPDHISVWIVEDNRAFRLNVQAAIDASPGLACTGSFGSCEAAFGELGKCAVPDVVLMDIGLPGMDGIEGIRRFRESCPSSEVIVLTVFEDEEKLLQAIRAGASGYLLKSARLEEIAQSIQLAHSGGSPMTPRIARRVLGFFHHTADTQRGGNAYRLTEREREILQALVEGLAKKEIAARHGVSFHTVDMHMRHIYEKLRVGSATAAVAKAMRERLV